MAAYGDDGFWSEDTCKLTDIIEDLPTLVRVCEGIYGSNEATTFSQGDLIKIDACKPMTRVTAYLTQPSYTTARYEKFGSEISLPYHYNGRVRVEPLHGEYHTYNSVKDLIEYFPRNIRVLGHIGFKDPTGKPQELNPGAILELKAVRRNTSGFTTSLRCTLQGRDIILPRDTSGVFQVLPDEEEQTIRTVVETYKLPQCVRFIGHGVQEIMSRDIQEAIHNLTTYSGVVILTGKMESAPVLFGHYKGLERDEASSRFCRRSAVVIPLDTPEIINIDVQLPSYLDPSDYELFLLKNFSQSTSTPQFLEGALYADFSKSTKVQFIPKTTPPAIPPRRKPGDDTRTEDSPDTPPPVPRRLDRGKQGQKPNLETRLPPKTPPKRSASLAAVRPHPNQVPRQMAAEEPSSGAAGLKLGLGSLIADAFTTQDINESTGKQGQKPNLETRLPPKTPPKRSASLAAVRPHPNQVPRQMAAEEPSSGAAGLKLGLGSLIADAFTTQDINESTGKQGQKPNLQTGLPPKNPPKRSASLAAVKPHSNQVPRQMAAEEPSSGDAGLGSLISDVFTTQDDIYESTDVIQLPIELKKHKELFKKMLSDLVHKVRTERKGDPSLGFDSLQHPCEEEDSSPDDTHDYVEIDKELCQKMLSKANKSQKPILKVSPSVLFTKPAMAEPDLSEMTISELETVLTRCGMGELAKVCKRECVDGLLFASFTRDILKKKPFKLSEWKITKVNKLKNGWRPKSAC